MRAEDGSELEKDVNATFFADTGGGWFPACLNTMSCTLDLFNLDITVHRVAWKATVDGKPIADQWVVSWTVDICTTKSM